MCSQGDQWQMDGYSIWNINSWESFWLTFFKLDDWKDYIFIKINPYSLKIVW